MTLEDMLFKMPDGDTFLIVAEHASVEYFDEPKLLKITCNGNDYYVKQLKNFPSRPTEDVMVTINLNTLGFEWFVAPHESIDNYSEPIKKSLVLDAIRHFYVLHRGYDTMLIEDTQVGREFVGYMRDLFDGKCNTTLDGYKMAKNILTEIV